jgi:hypothetical protein
MEDTAKVCRKCGQILTLDMFYKDSRYKDGYTNYCKACCVATNKTNRQLKRSQAKHITNKLTELNCATTNEEAIMLGINIIEYALDSFKTSFVEYILDEIMLSAEDKRALVKHTKDQIDTFKKDLQEMGSVL